MTYDYILLGGGAAGLSLAHRMVSHPFFKGKKIALVESSSKKNNDRTWCFWSTSETYYEEIVQCTYEGLLFYGDYGMQDLDMGGYRYHMIRGIDFYEYNYSFLADKPIDIITDEVVDLEEDTDAVYISLKSGKKLQSRIVFKSYVDSTIEYGKHPSVKQHFKGWVIETDTEVFDPKQATFMDFRIQQNNEVRFMYILPMSASKALVEVAIFSDDSLDIPEYTRILSTYIDETLAIEKYEIVEEEFGVIPMTSYPFYGHNTNRIYGIGTMGGAVKASSGFAFQRIQQHSDAIIAALVEGRPLDDTYTKLKNRYAYYDKIFLHAVLNRTTGKKVFSRLFKKRKAHEIFEFLDGDTRLLDDIMLFTAPPFFPFLRSFFSVLR